MKTTSVSIFLMLLAQLTFAQKAKDVFVDKSGVMRWGDSKKEVYGFGVNYTTPFAHAYRSAKKLNVDLEKAIENDVYHFSRLGFDAFRVHVWDTEISDSVGNLLENDHLRLFDFMLHKMKQRGIKIFLTPIAFWGNGYPERDDKTPGFASKYGKEACLTNPEAIKAQENYLYQFVRHINPYTKLAYKDDPDIVAFEISNEPHHRGTPEEVTTFINRMSASIKKTGCRKPIFYNVSHSVHLGDAYFRSDIVGGTFQWYPTGLGARHELRGNFLPNVDRYTMPFNHLSSFKSMAKIVYEFDAADVGRSYIYPAMARSFREAGIQWATHFAYDPTFMAYANTEYNTHYMNLAYAPQKALSLKIASEVFHQVPRYKKYPAYPANQTFDNFRVSYEEDLAEMVTEKKFIYTNHTKTDPVKAEALEEVSGFGNSPVVRYEGKGAYFLDRIENGVWRLEVMPDAIWVDNIFGRNSLKKQVAVINWRTWPMSINLPDLGRNFQIKALSGSPVSAVSKLSFPVSPGVYLLIRAGVTSTLTGGENWKNIRLNEFSAPETDLKKVYVLHEPSKQITPGKPLAIRATVVAREKPDKISLHYGMGFSSRVVIMEAVTGYDYQFEIPAADVLKTGFLTYHISASFNEKTFTFPSGTEGLPFDWDFVDQAGYKVPVVEGSSPVYVFNAVSDADELSREWRRGSEIIPGAVPGIGSLAVAIEKLFQVDPENKNGSVVHDYSMRYNFAPRVSGRREDLKKTTRLILRGQSVDKDFPVQVALVDRNGNTFGAVLPLSTAEKDYVLNLADFKPVPYVVLPRPYPTFLPYYFQPVADAAFDPGLVETIQISVGPGLTNVNESFRFMVESIRLE